MPLAEAPKKPLYIFLDESGNFDFRSSGTKYFILTALTCTRPFPWENELSELRYSLWENNAELNMEYFHASEDRQLVRDQVFQTLSPHLGKFRVDSVIVEKRKTNPKLQSVEKLYPQMMGYLLKYVFVGHPQENYSSVNVITDRIPVSRKRGVVEKAVKTTLSSMLGETHRYNISHRESKSCFSLQAADYVNWAIYRKWEKQDPRSHEIVRSCIQSEFDIFRMGTTHFY